MSKSGAFDIFQAAAAVLSYRPLPCWVVAVEKRRRPAIAIVGHSNTNRRSTKPSRSSEVRHISLRSKTRGPGRLARDHRRPSGQLVGEMRPSDGPSPPLSPPSLLPGRQAAGKSEVVAVAKSGAFPPPPLQLQPVHEVIRQERYLTPPRANHCLLLLPPR